MLPPSSDGHGSSSNERLTHSLKTSCSELQRNGLDHSMYDLLVILHGSTTVDLLAHTGLANATYAAYVRGKMQLEVLYDRFRAALASETGYKPSLAGEICGGGQ